MKQSELLRKRGTDIQAFLDAYRQLLPLHRETRAPGAFTTKTLVPKKGREAAIAELRAELAVRAPSAHGYEQRFAINGMALPGLAGQGFRPIRDWQFSITHPWLVKPEMVIAEALSVIRRLELNAEEAEADEAAEVAALKKAASVPARVKRLLGPLPRLPRIPASAEVQEVLGTVPQIPLAEPGSDSPPRWRKWVLLLVLPVLVGCLGACLAAPFIGFLEPFGTEFREWIFGPGSTASPSPPVSPSPSPSPPHSPSVQPSPAASRS